MKVVVPLDSETFCCFVNVCDSYSEAELRRTAPPMMRSKLQNVTSRVEYRVEKRTGERCRENRFLENVEESRSENNGLDDALVSDSAQIVRFSILNRFDFFCALLLQRKKVMAAFRRYGLLLKGEMFGMIYSSMPLLKRVVSDLDKATWSDFVVNELEEGPLSWINKRKMTQITKQIMNAFGFDWNTQDFFFVVCDNEQLEIEKWEKYGQVFADYATALHELGLNPLDLYHMPELVNCYNRDTGEDDPATLETFHQMVQMKETLTLSKEGISRLSQVFKGTFHDSIFPDESHCVFSMMKFMSYFRYFIRALIPMARVVSSFEMDKEMFPAVIQSFTLKYIPSFTSDHNAIETLGDAVLGLVVRQLIIKAAFNDKNYFINRGVNMTVSNQLFATIAASCKFEECVIGPLDVEKVTADCFEALAGSVFLEYGFEHLHKFFVERMFVIDEKTLAVKRITKYVEMMKLDVQVKIEPGNPATAPDAAKELMGDMNCPPEGSFVSKSEMHTKCKMIGTSMLKATLAFVIYNTKPSYLAKLHEFMKGKNAANDCIAQKLGFQTIKALKAFLGGLVLVNDFDRVFEMTQARVAPAFDIFPRRRRRRRHSHTEE